jgi:hypothetical protein
MINFIKKNYETIGMCLLFTILFITALPVILSMICFTWELFFIVINTSLVNVSS